MEKNTKNEIIFHTCLLLVKHFRMMKENDLAIHTRLFSHILHPEQKFVHIGNSNNVTEDTKNHPEHVVPCLVLIDETCRLIENEEMNDEQIASLLQKHWKIATITKDEAHKVDHKLGYKSKMPDGWCFETGDTLARLKEADIDTSPFVEKNKVISLFASRKTNDDKKILEKNISEIDLFIKSHICKDTVIEIGSMHTSQLRSHLEELGYRFVIQELHRGAAIYEKNQKMIRKSDMVLIINLDQSTNMTDFEEYAKEQAATDESVFVLSLSSD